ncbi:hypothetical protein [Gaiella sp.]
MSEYVRGQEPRELARHSPTAITVPGLRVGEDVFGGTGRVV